MKSQFIPAKPKRKLLAVLVSAALLATPAIPRAEPQTLRFAPLSNQPSPSALYFDIPLAVGESLTDIRLVTADGAETSLLSLFDLQAATSGVSARFRNPIDFSAHYGTSFTLRLLKTDATGAANEEWLRLLVVAPDELAQDLRLVAVTDGSQQPDAIAFVVPGAVNMTLDDIQYIDNGQPISIKSLFDLTARRDGGMQAELHNIDLDGMAGGDIELRARMTAPPNTMPIERKLLLTPIRRDTLTQDATVDIVTSGDSQPDAFTLALATSANIEVHDIALNNQISLLDMFELVRATHGALSSTLTTAIDFDPYIGTPIALHVRKSVAGSTYTQKITLVAQLPLPRLTAVTDGTLAIDGRVAPSNAIRNLRYALYTDAAGTTEVTRAATAAFANLVADSEYHVGTVATAGNGTLLKSPLLAVRTLQANPHVFTFDTVNGAARNSVTTSGTITITGILGQASVSIGGGEYQIDGGTWTTSAGLVSNGQTLRVRSTAANAYSTTSTVTLTVGTRSASFQLITENADTTPNAFSFTDVTGHTVGTVVESNTITVAGINTATSISVTGGEYQIDGGAWTNTASTVTNGQTVKARHTTSASNSTATNTTLTIGGVSDTFTTTTAAPVADTTPNAFDIVNMTNQSLGTAVTTGSITVSGIDTSVTASTSVGTLVKNGTDTGLTSATVVNNDTVAVKVTTSGSYSTAVNGTLTISGVTDNFSVTTLSDPGSPPDTTPDTFTFTDATDQALSTVVESNAITVASINTAAAISVTGGEYQINGGAWSSTASTVTNGQTVKVRHTTSASNSTATNTTLTIGGISDIFTTTTVADTTPNAFDIVNMTNQALSTAVTTNAITVAGINQSVTASTTVGTIVKNGVDTGNNSATVANGDTVAVKVTTSGSYSMAIDGTLTIGTGATSTDNFSVTTLAEPAPNNAPVPTFDAFTMNEDAVYNGTLTAIDADGNSLTFAKVADPAHGTVTVNADGTFTYTPTADYFGADSFTYSVSDGTATVNKVVNITVNDVAEPDTTAPATPTLTIDSGAAYTNATAVAVSITGDTDNVGVTGWFVSESSSAPVLGDFIAEPTTATMSAGDGVKTLYVWTRDAAGNISGAGSDTIVLDTVAPTAMSFSGTTPEWKSTGYTGLVLDLSNTGINENLIGGSITSMTPSGGGAAISTFSINGSGQIQFNWTTPAAASSNLRAQGTDRAGNAFDITLTVNLPN